MAKYKQLLPVLLLTGCSLLPNLQERKTASVLIKPMFVSGNYSTKDTVNNNTSATINHLILELMYTPSLALVATRDIPQTSLGNSIAFANLKANTSYRVLAKAYRTAGTTDLISLTDANSYANFTTTNDDRPAIAQLKVKLTDVPFNGQGTSSLVITNGGYIPSTEEMAYAKLGSKTIAGNGISTCTDGIGTAAKLATPYGVVYNNGKLYIAENSSHRIRELDLATNQVATFAGSTAGWADGIGTAAKFSYPHGITVDNGNLYITDYNTNRIRMLDLATKQVTTIAGDGSLSYADGVGTTAQFSYPEGIAVYNGKLYVADSGNHCIREINLSTKQVTTIAGSTAGWTAGEGFADGIGNNAMFDNPKGLAIYNGKLYVADYYNNRIREIDLSTKQVTTIAGSNLIGKTDGVGTASKFYEPCGLATNNGKLYVTDNNSLIRKIDLDTKQVTTIAGNNAGYADGFGTASQFSSPNDLIVDLAGKIYIADSWNNRIRLIDCFFE